MTLDDLKKSISQMSTEELMALMKETRAARRLRKPVEPKKPAQPKPQTLNIDSISSEDARKLLKILGVKHGTKTD